MKITLKLFASLTDYLPVELKYTNMMEMDIAPDASIMQVITPLALPEKMVHLVLVNGKFVAPEDRHRQTMSEGDVLAIWPPIAGG